MSAFHPLRTFALKVLGLRLRALFVCCSHHRLKPLLPLSSAILLLGCAAGAQFPEPRYVWHSTNSGTSVQFGVQETDDRAFRMDCEHGQLSVAAPIGTDAPEGTSVTAVFQDGERRTGTIEYLGDGSNVVINLAPTDPLVEALVTADHIRNAGPGGNVSVPGAGGSKFLRSIVKRCVKR